METLTQEQFDALTQTGWLLGSDEGGASYRCGDDLVYWHQPGAVEYVRRPGYFKILPPCGQTVYFPLCHD